VTTPWNHVDLSTSLANWRHFVTRAADLRDPVHLALIDGLAESSGTHPVHLERLLALWAHPAGGDAAWSAPAGVFPKRFQPAGTVAIAAPGNLSVATWQAAAEALVCGNRVRVRASGHDPRAAVNLLEALRIAGHAAADRLAPYTFDHGDTDAWREFLADVDVLVALGGDGLPGVRQQVQQAGFLGPIRAHGPRVSAAVVATDALADVAAGLLHDAWLADGRGCLSLRGVWLVGDGDPQETQTLLRQANVDVRASLPLGPLPIAVVACARLAAEEWDFFAARKGHPSCIDRAAGDWLAVHHCQMDCPQAIADAPGGLPVHLVPDLAAVKAGLARLRSPLSSLAVAGPDELVEFAAELSPVRVCAPGELHAPRPWCVPDGQRPCDGLVVPV
jgi:hypothetical protein